MKEFIIFHFGDDSLEEYEDGWKKTPLGMNAYTIGISLIGYLYGT